MTDYLFEAIRAPDITDEDRARAKDLFSGSEEFLHWAWPEISEANRTIVSGWLDLMHKGSSLGEASAGDCLPINLDELDGSPREDKP